MSDLTLDTPKDDIPSSIINIDQPDSSLNNSINGTLNISDNTFGISYETMQVLFIAIATITVLICLIICLSVCICICLKRRHKLKHRENKDHLLPEQSNKKPLKIPLNNPSTLNGKQGSSIQQTTATTTAGATKTYYYDNLDDIPFIDESRPTSVIDITQV